MKKYRYGFSLVEIMTVMAIVGALVSIALLEGIKYRKLANESNCQANLKGIASGFEIYAAKNAGSYAPSEQPDLQYLIDSSCLFQDLTKLSQIGNFRYVVGFAGPAGYDIRGMAINPDLADHNYQITTSGTLRRSDTSAAGDIDFKDFN